MQVVRNSTPKKASGNKQGLFDQQLPIKNLVRLYHKNKTGRKNAELFIHQQFAAQYGANIQKFLPYLMTLESAGQISTGLGIRLAGPTPLFVEQYLDESIEKTIEKRHCISIKRHNLVEIGNLASAQKGLTKLLFMALTAYLQKTGVEWVVCNATPLVQNNFSRLGFQYFPLCKADKRRLITGHDQWGSYYDTPSEVTLINVYQAYLCLLGKPRLSALLETMGPSIERLPDPQYCGI